jgi:general secretion pathway protein H
MFLATHNALHRKSAFTLLELMVVIVLMGILTAMILPEMRGTYEDALLRSTSRKLVNVFTLANTRSIGLNQLHRVRLDIKAGRYALERKARENELRKGFVPVDNAHGGEGVLDSRITIEFHRPAQESPEMAGSVSEQNQTFEDTISFYPDGTADAGEILLRDRQGFALALRINPVTARIEILELERK